MVELQATVGHIEHQAAIALATHVIHLAVQAMSLDQTPGGIHVQLTDADTAVASDTGKHVTTTKDTDDELFGPRLGLTNEGQQQRQRIGRVTPVQVTGIAPASQRQHVMTHPPQQALRMPQHQGYARAQQGTQPQPPAAKHHFAGLQEVLHHLGRIRPRACGRWTV